MGGGGGGGEGKNGEDKEAIITAQIREECGKNWIKIPSIPAGELVIKFKNIIYTQQKPSQIIIIIKTINTIFSLNGHVCCAFTHKFK